MDKIKGTIETFEINFASNFLNLFKRVCDKI